MTKWPAFAVILSSTAFIILVIALFLFAIRKIWL